jgi:hypothetical protein
VITRNAPSHRSDRREADVEIIKESGCRACTSRRSLFYLVKPTSGRFHFCGKVYSANIQRERALRRGRAGPATTPSHKFSIHESLPMPFLSWRSQSFRHKSWYFKSVHNQKSKSHSSINIISKCWVQPYKSARLYLKACAILTTICQNSACGWFLLCTVFRNHWSVPNENKLPAISSKDLNYLRNIHIMRSIFLVVSVDYFFGDILDRKLLLKGSRYQALFRWPYRQCRQWHWRRAPP